MQERIESRAWLRPLEGSSGPRYLQIAALIEAGIADGHLDTGDRLPPQRSLAAALGVDLTTVTRAYDEARRRNLLEGRGAAGTFVAAPRADQMRMVDLSMNIPPPPAGVDLEELMRHGLSQVMLRADIDQFMTYHLGGGSEADKVAGAQWLLPVLGPVDPNLLTAAPGAQSALAGLMLSLTRADDVVLAEPVIYPGVRSAARSFGRRVEAVPTDELGMRPDALEKALRKTRARVIYLNPTIQNPTTVTMPEARRHEILAVVARLDASIIEDDPYWLLDADAPPPMARLAPDRVHYISTLSKCLSPGLRTAFVVSPDPDHQRRFLNALQAFSPMRTPLVAALVTQWIRDGSAARLLAGVRAEARERQLLASRVLGIPALGRHESRQGIHLWHLLPSYWQSDQLAAAARLEGLAVTPSTAFVGGHARNTNAIRICLGEGNDRMRLSGALKKLSRLLARAPTDAAQDVI
jgi:DNA-binding transcriptional MocR family regulator